MCLMSNVFLKSSVIHCHCQPSPLPQPGPTLVTQLLLPWHHRWLPSCGLRWEWSSFALLAVRNQQRDTYRLPWRAGSRQLCVSGIARDSSAAWYSLRPHLLYLWMLLHWWDGLLSFLKYTFLLFLNNNEFRNKSRCVVLIIYLWDLRGKYAT